MKNIYNNIRLLYTFKNQASFLVEMPAGGGSPLGAGAKGWQKNMVAYNNILTKIALCFLFSIFLCTTTFAQSSETIPITLEKVLELAGAKNLTIKEYKERQQLALADLAKAKEWWVPEIYAGARGNQLSGAAMNGNGRFFLDIDQNNLWLGIGAAANWDFAEGIYKTKAAKLKSEASQYRTVIEREKALLESVSAYYDLMGAQLNLGAYNNLLSQSEIIVQQIEIQVDAGLRFTSELLLAKSNKNHLAIAALSAKRDLNNASAKLLQLLNLDQNVTLLSVDSTLVPLEDSGEEITTSMNDYQRRPEIKALALDLEALKVASKIYTTGLLLPELHLDLNGSSFGRFNGNVNPIDPVTNPDPNQLYPTSAFAGSLLWRVPLGALIQKGDTKKAESLIRLKEIEAEQCKAQINEEVSRALSVLAVGREQILMAKEALDLSSEALSQSMERQRLGTAKPFEVFQAQQFYLQAEIDYIEVVGEYNKGWFAWRVAKGIGL